jgi:hypothetical protein
MDWKELAVRLAQHGLAAHRAGASHAVANADADVRRCGNAAVAAALERLGEHGVVTDVEPWFDADGIGFRYRVAVADDVGGTPQDIARWVLAKLEPVASDTSATVLELLSECRAVALNAVYADDLRASLRELATCFDEECYIACLALSGKILEIALKQLLIDHSVELNDHWMIGKLLAVVQDSHIPKYLDPSLRQIGEIINRSRIPAVHALERVPVPSREQAAMVINGVVDTVKRTLVAG